MIMVPTITLSTINGPVIIDLVPCYGLTIGHDREYHWYPLPEVNAYVEYSALLLGRFEYEPAHTLVTRIKARYDQLHQVELDDQADAEAEELDIEDDPDTADMMRIDAALRLVEADADFLERQAWLLNDD
jgi:hypothetical protein